MGVRVVLVEPAAIASEAPKQLEREAQQRLSEFSDTGRALYEDAFRQLVTQFTGFLRVGTAPSVVAETIDRALTTRRPRAHYLVGKGSGPQALMATLPAPIADAISRRVFHQPPIPRRHGWPRRGSTSPSTSRRGGPPRGHAARPS